jgi:DNA-binding NarL/FixJ family response regulator
MKVFIADDSREIRNRIVTMLSDLETIEIIGQAENVEDAINSIREINPDVVILDIRMPGGSGIDVLENIDKRNQVPVIIMLTNYPYPQYRKKCMDAGADFFFDKSGEFEKVIEVVSGISADSKG